MAYPSITSWPSFRFVRRVRPLMKKVKNEISRIFFDFLCFALRCVLGSGLILEEKKTAGFFYTCLNKFHF